MTPALEALAREWERRAEEAAGQARAWGEESKDVGPLCTMIAWSFRERAAELRRAAAADSIRDGELAPPDPSRKHAENDDSAFRAR